MDFTRPITNLDEGKAFVEELHRTDNMFHFEDSPDSVCHQDSLGRQVWSFTPEECSHLTLRVAELYDLDWKPTGEECPIGYALTVMGHSGHHEERPPTIEDKLRAASDDELRVMLTEPPPSALDIGASGEVLRIVSQREASVAHGQALYLVKAEMQRRGIE